MLDQIEPSALPEGLFSPFQLQAQGEPTRTPAGSWVRPWEERGVEDCALARASFRQVVLSTQVDYNISHQLVHQGPPRLEVGDRFRKPPRGPLDERLYYIREVENPGDLGLWTIYAVEERIEEGE
jgi:hypothetical protein